MDCDISGEVFFFPLLNGWKQAKSRTRELNPSSSPSFLCSSARPRSSSPSTPHQPNPPTSSLADLPTPRPSHSLVHSPSSNSSNLLSDLDDDDDDDLFSQSPMGSPVKRSAFASSTQDRGRDGKPLRSGRMSVAGGEIGGMRSMTLREQEKVSLSLVLSFSPSLPCSS